MESFEANDPLDVSHRSPEASDGLVPVRRSDDFQREWTPREAAGTRPPLVDVAGSRVAATSSPSPLRVDHSGLHFSSLASYLEIPFIHKWLIFGCTLLGMMSGWLALLVWPRTYESESRMMVRVGRESVSLDPTATTSSTLMMQKTQEEEIISALEVLHSRQVAEAVVERLGAGNILSGSLPREGPAEAEGFASRTKAFASNAIFQTMRFAGLKDNISDRELAVMEVQSAVWNHSPRKSAVLIVEGQSRSPEMAQAIVQEVTRAFMELHLQNARTQGSLAFFDAQAKQSETLLNELVSRRAEFLKERQIVSVDSSRQLLQQRLSGIDRDLMVATGELEEAQSSVEDLQLKYNKTDEEIVASKTAGSDATWSGMRQQVYELELAEQNLAANHTDSHPKLKSIRTQLQGSRSILAELESERVDESRTPNPLKGRLLEELQRQQTRAIGLASMIAEKRRRQTVMNQQIDELLEFESELSKIDRDIAVAESSTSALRQKLEEARVIDELQTEKISNVHVFQPATFVERAVSPKKPVLAMAFVMLGIAGGLGLSVLRQATTATLRTEEDVLAQTGCPVVSSIPKFRRINAMRFTEEKRFQESCQGVISEVFLAQRRAGHSRGRSLGVIGIDLNVGASTLAIHLAKASATDCRLRTVLVDGDARQRSVSKSFGLNGKPGLVELVNGGASHDECLQHPANVPMDLISSSADTCGDLLTNCAPAIAEALHAYLEQCDLLIVDLPAASQPDQAIAIAQHLDSVLVVVESEVTQTAATERLLRRLHESDTEVIGVVLNKTHNYLPVWLRRCVGSHV